MSGLRDNRHPVIAYPIERGAVMGKKEDLDRFYNEQRLGQRGISTGSAVNNAAFRKYESDRKAEQQSREVWNNLPPPPRIPAYTPPRPLVTPGPVVGPDRFPPSNLTKIEDFSRNRRKGVSGFFSAIWTGIIGLSLLIVSAATIRAYYERNGAEGLLVAALWVAVIGLSLLAVACLFQILKWFFGTIVGRFLIKMLQFAVIAIAVMATILLLVAYMSGT